MVVGGRCESACDTRLINVFCNPQTKKCECEKNNPVKLGNYTNMMQVVTVLCVGWKCVNRLSFNAVEKAL